MLDNFITKSCCQNKTPIQFVEIIYWHFKGTQKWGGTGNESRLGQRVGQAGLARIVGSAPIGETTRARAQGTPGCQADGWAWRLGGTGESGEKGKQKALGALVYCMVT